MEFFIQLAELIFADNGFWSLHNVTLNRDERLRNGVCVVDAAPTAKATSELELTCEALMQSGCGALITDNSGVICYVNPKLCEITGYSREELLGNNPRMLQSGLTPRDTYLALWNSVSSGRSWRGVLKNRRKNGEAYWESISISPIKLDTGEISHFSAIVQDVTSEREQEALLGQIELESQQNLRYESMELLARGLAHDLNNCLTAVLVGADLIKVHADQPSKVREFAETISAAGERSIACLRQAREFSGRTIAAREPIDLRELTKRHLDQYDEMVGEKLLLSWESDGASATCVGDPALIHEAIKELISNAIAAVDAYACVTLATGTVPVVQAEPTELLLSCGIGGSPAAFVEIREQGKGMDEGTLLRAFDPFFSTKRGHKGLGLSSIVGTMRGHGGAIAILSAPGKGTRVRLYFALTSQF